MLSYAKSKPLFTGLLRIWLCKKDCKNYTIPAHDNGLRLRPYRHMTCNALQTRTIVRHGFSKSPHQVLRSHFIDILRHTNGDAVCSHAWHNVFYFAIVLQAAKKILACEPTYFHPSTRKSGKGSLRNCIQNLVPGHVDFYPNLKT